jgi:serine/threonine protein kinase
MQGIWLKVTYLLIYNKGLLIKDPKKRLTLKQVMDHPWLRTEKLSNEIKSNSATFLSFTQAGQNTK